MAKVSHSPITRRSGLMPVNAARGPGPACWSVQQAVIEAWQGQKTHCARQASASTGAQTEPAVALADVLAMIASASLDEVKALRRLLCQPEAQRRATRPLRLGPPAV